jgi:pyridoxine kinase
VTGGIVRGLPLPKAFQIACDYTRDTIAYTYKLRGKDSYGVDFETTIPELVRTLEKA